MGESLAHDPVRADLQQQGKGFGPAALIVLWGSDGPLSLLSRPPPVCYGPVLALGLDVRSLHLSITFHSGLCLAIGMGTLSQSVPRTDSFVGRL